MDSSPFALAAMSDALAACAYAAFAVGVVRLGALRAPRSAVAIALLGAVSMSAVWGGLSLSAVLQRSVSAGQIATLADLCRYGSWYVFLWLLFRSNSNGAVPKALRWMSPLGCAACLLALGGSVADIVDGGRWPSISKAQQLAWIALPLLGLVLVEQLVRNVVDDARWNAKPLCIGLAGTFAFDAYLFSQAALFNRVDLDSVAVRGTIHSLMLPFLMMSMSRRGNWFGRLRISRKAAFHSATLLIAGLYLLLVSVVGYYLRFFGGDIGGALLQILLCSALAFLTVLAVSGAVRARLRVFVQKHFFRYRYDYREEWLKFTQTLSLQQSPQAMGQQVIQGLAAMLESPGGGLWTRAPVGDAVVQVARWNLAECKETEPLGSPFCRFLAQSGWVVDLDEHRASPQRYGDLALPDWLRSLGQAWLVVPLKVGDELTGFVVLAVPRTPMEINWEVQDLLKTAGRQAASVLSQMQATEALLEARKFDAFNRMSAFVVHDLKNIVTQLSLMMKNAQRLHANPEFQQDMLMTVENSLTRMRQLMLQLRMGGTPTSASFGIDLGSVAERIRDVSGQRGKTLELRSAERVVARGDAERLERIIGHVVQNAFDATEPEGNVWLSVDRLGGQARVCVGDDGCGMSQEFTRQRLFKPFQTTKQAGMGIGAYESFQYVQELGGKMLVDSEPGKGTLVTMLLPLFIAENDSDLHLREAS